MTARETRPHSAAYFGPQRDEWWNRDFLELVAQRHRLGEVRQALDVGCGVGHWSSLVLPLLAPGARLTGIDRELAWVRSATERFAREAAGRAQFVQADAHLLPFRGATFELTTCQTLLMHLAEPERAIAEMVRVTRPGGGGPLRRAEQPHRLAVA